MRETAMAHSLGFGGRSLHWTDGAPGTVGKSSLVPSYGSRRALRPICVSPRPGLFVVHARERSTVRNQVQSSDQSQPGTSSELQTLSTPASSSPAPPAYIGSPLMWIGVGVGISVLFSWAAGYAKSLVWQQALKTAMQSNQFGPMPGSPFPYPPPSQPAQPVTATPKTLQSPVSTPQAAVSASVTAPVEPQVVKDAPVSENNKPAFKDIDVDSEAETKVETVVVDSQQQKEEKSYFKDAEVKDSGTGFTWNTDDAASTSSDGKAGSPFFSVETLEKMLEDPTVQQMVYPYLPQEMRNPSTFKWMMQNPQFKAQLQEMLNNMTDDTWKSAQMSDVLKNFNPNNQELKQQFEQIGLSPEEVMAKMVANPEIAMAFQNPKIQAALIDCSNNPANITKYQGDPEIMDVFNKIAELFPMKGF